MPQYQLRAGSLQDEFFTSRNKIQIYGGGYGNGKTSAACIKGLHFSLLYPGSNGLIARSTYPVLNDTIRKEFLKWCPPDLIKRRPNDKDNTLILSNGTTINFRYLSQRGKGAGGDTTSNVLSATYDWIIVDQVEDPEITYKDFIDLMGRLRGNTPLDPTFIPGIPPLVGGWPKSGPRMMILTLNPTRNWAYRQLVKPVQLYKTKHIKVDDLIVNEKTGEVMIDLVEGSTYENQENLPADFIEGLEATYKGQMRDRFLQGEWAAYEGLIYPQFDQTVHMLDRDIVEKYYKMMFSLGVAVREGYDFGIAAPSCYLYGFIDPFENVFIMDGFYKPEYEVKHQAADILRIRHNYQWDLFNRDAIYADPAIFKRTGIGRPISQVFSEDYGVDMQRGDNEILAGITRVGALLNVHKFHKHPIFETFEAPRMYFADHLQFIADELSDYYWHKDTSNTYEDKPVDKNDHACDTIKYLTSRLDGVTKAERVKVTSELGIPMTWREFSGKENARSYRYG